MNFIPIVTAICLCTSYDPLLGCATSWGSFRAYFLYITFYCLVVILIYLYSQRCINISLFESVVTYIETHICVPSFLISHIFISVIKFFCFFSLLLGQPFTLNILHPKTCIQHNIYTIFEKTFRFSFFVLIHTRLQRVTLTTRKGFLYLPSFSSRGCLHWYRLQKSGFKSTSVVLICPTIQGLVEDAMYFSQGGIPMSTEAMLVISGSMHGA